MSLVKLLQDATGKRSLWDIVKQAGVYIALDGNWMETVAQLSGALAPDKHPPVSVCRAVKHLSSHSVQERSKPHIVSNRCRAVKPLWHFMSTKKPRLVGTDDLGNKYYEDTTRPYGRHRWVVYKTLGDYNASSIHPHWHAWIHMIDDRTPVDTPVKEHKYAPANYVPNSTGMPDAYLPKGSWKNANQRNWMKTEFWSPP